MIVDRDYCMSSFLMYRIITDENKCFHQDFLPNYKPMPDNRIGIGDSEALFAYLKEAIAKKIAGRKCALALSGGIDSAILLKLMPEGTKAYTFKCTIPGMQVTDESPQAASYIAENGIPMEHHIVPVYWEDMESMSVDLMKQKGAPIHSIEVQIYKAACQAKADGCDLFVFGETADCVYGGHSNLYSRDWKRNDFIKRWSFVDPAKALKNPVIDLRPYDEYDTDVFVDIPSFLTYFEAPASLNSYRNACQLAGIELYAPYAHTIMNVPLDLERVRRGENKYIVREVFEKLYSGFEVPEKVPMPRPMNEWLSGWAGPKRPEFIPGCTESMTGDQKWLVYSLEKFLNILDCYE